jgi:hypothetical protein
MDNNNDNDDNTSSSTYPLHISNNSPINSPMQIGLAGPSTPGAANIFTADEITELLGFGANSSSDSDLQDLVPILPQQRMRINSLDGTDDIITAATASTTTMSSSVLPSIDVDAATAATDGATVTTSATTNESDNNTNKNDVRSERKRSREKQRRTDVNKQFNELTDVIKRLEAEEQKNQNDIIVREQQQDREREKEYAASQKKLRNDTTDDDDDGCSSSSSNKRLRTAATDIMPMTLSSFSSSSSNAIAAMSCVLPPFSPTNRVDLIARTIAHLDRLSRVTNKQRLEISSLEEQLMAAKKAGEDTASKLKQAISTVSMNMANSMNMNMNGGSGGSGGMMSPMMMGNGNGIPPPIVAATPLPINPMTAMNNNMMGIQPQKPQVRRMNIN